MKTQLLQPICQVGRDGYLNAIDENFCRYLDHPNSTKERCIWVFSKDFVFSKVYLMIDSGAAEELSANIRISYPSTSRGS
jgi:hypothetical protein